MVYYGPWQEGRTHVEIIHGKDRIDTDPPVVHELLSPEPTRRSGWNITWAGWGIESAYTWEHEGGISDPPPPSAPNSQAAFLAASGVPAGTGSGWQFSIVSTGERHKISVGSPWLASHGWAMDGQEYRLGYVFINDIGAEYAVPEGVDPFTDDYYTELEPWALGGDYEDARIELISATVLGPGNLGTYGLFSKDAGTLADPGSEFLHYGPIGYGPSEINMAPFGLDVDNMTELMEYITENGFLPAAADSNDHPAMPRMSWLYIGPVLSDPHFDGEHVISEVEGMPVQIRIEYKFPRWRHVFYENPRPYRRIRPRKDGRAGGAGRNGALSNARQSSRRTSGTYT